jgi:hypothetical protein
MQNTHLKKEHVHDLYSLRWQIEILFKTWKSIFHIDRCKPIKTERFDCHVYGQLIASLLSSSLMFQIRRLLLIKKKKEASEFKVICILKEYFLSKTKPPRLILVCTKSSSKPIDLDQVTNGSICSFFLFLA